MTVQVIIHRRIHGVHDGNISWSPFMRNNYLSSGVLTVSARWCSAANKDGVAIGHYIPCDCATSHTL